MPYKLILLDAQEAFIVFKPKTYCLFIIYLYIHFSRDRPVLINFYKQYFLAMLQLLKISLKNV